MRIRWALAGVAVLAVAAVGVAAVRGDAPARPLAPPTSDADATEPPAQARPKARPTRFRVRLVSTSSPSTQNAGLFGRRTATAGRRAVRKAAAGATRQLADYLDAAFLRRGRGVDPLRGLLTADARRALTPAARRALGVTARRRPPNRAGVAQVRAVALHDRDEVSTVTLSYRATIRPWAGRPLVQEGAMVFLPREGGWKADLVDVRLVGPAGRTSP